MAFTKFVDLPESAQIDLLYQALKQLQQRFDDHDHRADGSVRIGVFNDTVEIDGIFEEE